MMYTQQGNAIWAMQAAATRIIYVMFPSVINRCMLCHINVSNNISLYPLIALHLYGTVKSMSVEYESTWSQLKIYLRGKVNLVIMCYHLVINIC